MSDDLSAELRRSRDALFADRGRHGREFGRAYCELVDDALRRIFAAALEQAGVDPGAPVAVIALGSYGRRELCPGSDLDVVLLHGLSRRRATVVADLSQRLWYPLWDAGFVTGHGTRTIKESVSLADSEPDALTASLQTRHICGDSQLSARLLEESRVLARKRADRLVEHLAAACEVRRVRPGPIAEVLEPDIKDGAGGLRDLQSLDWSGWTLGAPGGLAALSERGFLGSDDQTRLAAAADLLLEVRVALHRQTRGKSDRLVLQEQDAVAQALAFDDADVLIRRLSGASREVAWIAQEVFDRLSRARQPPRRHAVSGERAVTEHVIVRDGRITFTGLGQPSVLTVLEMAVAAADLDVRIDRASLAAISRMPEPDLDVWERAAFLRLLRAGEGAMASFEALDHAGVLVRLLPEWAHVRSRPQRNAYHRFTVDRHLLEAVAECANLLDSADASTGGESAGGESGGRAYDRGAPGDGIVSVVARATRRPELLCLAALLHDIGKGRPGDHSTVGAQLATTITRRMGLDAEGREIVDWLVRDHLLMADTATRRDLADEAVIQRFADVCVGDPERLRLLYLLTIGDSKATGPAAWNRTKDSLLRDLFVKAAHVIEERGASVVGSERRDALVGLIGENAANEHLERFPASYGMAFDAPDMENHRRLLESHDTVVEILPTNDGRFAVTVVAQDRPGLLAAISGALTISGMSVREAFLFSTDDGRALDVFRLEDPFDRLGEGGLRRVQTVLERAIGGDIDIERMISQRVASYPAADAVGPIEVLFDLGASESATVIEVDAPDQVGLLYDIASTIADEGLDVSVAKVLTLAERIVDVFYVTTQSGEKLTDEARLDHLRSELVRRLEARTSGS